MLDQRLEEYAKSDIYPFHMPGHKRRWSAAADPYAIDITEIDGFDNLHHAEEVLKDAQERAADLYGSKRAYYLVNGSTCGLLAAIGAACRRRGGILVARNCHKAVYHGIYMQELTAHYLYPGINAYGIACAITPEQIKKGLKQHPDVDAVLLTSPTYEGVVSDIAQIAELVHAHNIPLIVDEAHGAHFGLAEDAAAFPDSAVHCGADLVVQSLHKTLPSYTQTALLHVCSNRVPEERVAQFLDIYETSSPSYILMAGMERCIRYMREAGAQKLCSFRERLDWFGSRMTALQRLKLIGREDFSKEQAFDFDASKLLIYTGNAGITGKVLYDMLLQDYGLQMEMAAGNYVLAMTSLMDVEDGFERLEAALLEIDTRLSAEQTAHPTALLKGDARLSAGQTAYPAEDAMHLVEHMAHLTEHRQLSQKCTAGEITRSNVTADSASENVSQFAHLYTPQEQVCTIAEALDGAQETVELKNATGRTAADYIYLYPPGIPLLAPGERITEKAVKDICLCLQSGFTVHGLLPDAELKVVISL